MSQNPDLAGLDVRLRDTQDRVRRLRGSGIEAGEAVSLSDLETALATGIEIAASLSRALEASSGAEAVRLALELQDHARKEIAREPILSDIDGVRQEAEEELNRRVGRHRNPVKAFLEDAGSLKSDLADIVSLADQIYAETEIPASPEPRKETDMNNDEELRAIRDAIEQVGKQISFTATGSAPAPAAASGPARGATDGAFRSVAGQLTATLDALGMPHYGVQFANDKSVGAARDLMIDGLLDGFEPSERNGTTIYKRSDSTHRSTKPQDSWLISGAAKTAARRVRAEADNILDILGHLPDLTRFRSETGVVDSQDALRVIEAQFTDLDAIMADPFGVNLPRAHYTIARIGKAVRDYLDYADLEPEFNAVARATGGDLCELLQLPDSDEVSQRRTVAQSEEIEAEIRELVGALKEMVEDILAPISAKRGHAAARLELAMSVIHGSALDLRDIMVRTGSTLDEQELITFVSQLTVTSDIFESATEGAARGPLSLAQLLDWIIEVSASFTGASFRASARERDSLVILRRELGAQMRALDKLLEESRNLRLTLTIPRPLHQLEVLRFQVAQAEKQAAQLVYKKGAER